MLGPAWTSWTGHTVQGLVAFVLKKHPQTNPNIYIFPSFYNWIIYMQILYLKEIAEPQIGKKKKGKRRKEATMNI